MRYLPLLLFSAACVDDPMDDVRRPCPDSTAWDPNRPVGLRWGDSGFVDLNEHVARRITVSLADGAAVEGLPFAFKGGLGLCVIGGLKADTDYTWVVTDGSEPAVQEWDPITTRRTGSWRFHTAATSEVSAPESVGDCVNLANAKRYDTQCAAFDSADTGGAP